jgi:hypothetical protein
MRTSVVNASHKCILQVVEIERKKRVQAQVQPQGTRASPPCSTIPDQSHLLGYYGTAPGHLIHPGILWTVPVQTSILETGIIELYWKGISLRTAEPALTEEQ